MGRGGGVFETFDFGLKNIISENKTKNIAYRLMAIKV